MPKGQNRSRRVTSASIAPEADQSEALIDETEVIQSGRDLLTRLSLRLPARPRDRKGNPLDPEFPADLSKCTDEEISRLHGQFRAMADYALGKLSLLETRAEVTEHNEKLERTFVSLKAEGSVKDREAQGLTNNVVRERTLKRFQRKAQFRLLRAVAEGFDRKAKALSREVTIRQKTLEDREL